MEASEQLQRGNARGGSQHEAPEGHHEPEELDDEGHHEPEELDDESHHEREELVERFGG